MILVRITQGMLAHTVLRNISTAYDRIGKNEDRLSSGKLYNQPSDNPFAVSQGLNIRQIEKSIDQYLSNINDGTAWLETGNAALTAATDLLARAKELAVQGANGINTQNDLNVIAKEIDNIVSEMINVGNSTYDGRYVFGGNKTTAAPFTYVPAVIGPPLVPASVTYNGDSGNINYEIEKGVTVSINLPGDSVFKAPTDVFQVLIGLSDHLKAGDFASISADTSLIDNATNMLTDAQATLGSKLNRLEVTRERHEEDKLNLAKALSSIEDADMAEVLTKLKMDENVYQAALATGSMAIQKSLIDFLK